MNLEDTIIHLEKMNKLMINILVNEPRRYEY